jgi:hypothetical protein
VQTFSFTWERELISDHFNIHYNVTGPNSITEGYAIEISNSLEHAWTLEVDGYDFRTPPDSDITVYVMELTGSYGTTYGIRYGSNDYHVSNVTIDRNMETDLLHYVCAHEFFHCIQLSYSNTAKWFIDNVEDWVLEGTAVWMGSLAHPEYAGDVSYIAYANECLKNPDLTISLRSYDAVLYWLFIYEHHGGINTIRQMMEQNDSLNAIQAMNSTLNLSGKTFTEVFKEWTIANYLKNSYYSKGALFQGVFCIASAYDGSEETWDSTVTDWGTDYFEVASSVIYMPMEFLGEESHNVTKVFIEHGTPIISDLTLDATSNGVFHLVQANNLDKIVIIVRSLGDETSNNFVIYTVKLLPSSCTFDGPYESIGITPAVAVAEKYAAGGSLGLFFAAVNLGSSHDSSTQIISASSASGGQISSYKDTTVVGKTSFQDSSETNIQLQFEFDLNLNAGWNMASFPVIPANTSFSSIFSGVGHYQVLTWSGTSYVAPTNVEAGRGYWVLVLSATTVDITGLPVESYERDLPAGWSMIGSVYGTAVDAETVFPDYYQLLTWSGTSYIAATTIEPGKGYWALVLTPTQIKVQ